MRVLVIGTGELDCAAANCGLALKAMGHEVRHFDPEQHPAFLAPLRRSFAAQRVVDRVLSLAGAYNKLYEPALIRLAEEFCPHLVLVIPIYALTPETVGHLANNIGARVAGWFQDHIANFGRHAFLLADYHGLFFKDRFIVERLRDYAGLTNVYYLPESCEPRRHHPLPLTDQDRQRHGCDLMVYGNLYPYRLRLLEAVADHDLRLYGPRPSHWVNHPLAKRWSGRELYFDEKIRAVLAARITVNTAHFGEVYSTNARTFEVAGIGGFQVADAPGVGEYFEVGREIVTFKGPKMLREVVDHYLARPEERNEIARRAQARAHREHTYERRLAQLCETIGLDPYPRPTTQIVNNCLSPEGQCS